MPEQSREIRRIVAEVGAESVARWQEQIVNPELTEAPHLELSPRAQAQLAELINKLNQNDRPAVIAVIRCWNKSEGDLKALQTKLKTMRAQIPELAGALIAINADQDIKNTAATIESLEQDQIPLITAPVRGYSWTAGLNGPAALLHAGLKSSPQTLAKTEILNVSFDADIPDSSLKVLHTAAANSEPALSVRIEESVTDPEHAAIVKEEYEEEIKALFRTTRDLITNKDTSDEDRARVIELQGKALAILCRNTNLMAPLADIAKAGGFDPFCNGAGGMEDHDFLWRLSFASDPNTQQAYRNALQDPVFFQDTAWNATDESKQDKRDFKYGHEVKALQTIVARLARSIQAGNIEGLRVAQNQQDFRF